MNATRRLPGFLKERTARLMMIRSVKAKGVGEEENPGEATCWKVDGKPDRQGGEVC